MSETAVAELVLIDDRPLPETTGTVELALDFTERVALVKWNH